MHTTPIIRLAIVLFTLHNIAFAQDQTVGRYQLLIISNDTKSGTYILAKIDTATGKTWIYDTQNMDILTPEESKKLNITDAMIAKNKANGYFFGKAPFWKPLSESLIEYQLRQMSVK